MAVLECRYFIESGEFDFGSALFAVRGYSGRKGDARNNPAYCHVRNVGPIPHGLWIIDRDPYNSPTTGRLTFRLRPQAGTETHGRSAFLIHGDNAEGDASRGCIVLDREARQKLADLLKSSGQNAFLHVFARNDGKGSVPF